MIIKKDYWKTCPKCGHSEYIKTSGKAELKRMLGEELGLKPKGKNINGENYYNIGELSINSILEILDAIKIIKGNHERPAE